MVTTIRPATEQKMVTGTINGEAVTVPAGTFILEAARMNGIEVPNLCYQPLLRPWGSCRICTVEILGKRGGMIESCATPLAEGMEVVTHSPEVIQARQFVLQMYLIDHALDCPTCDKSGECYLQDNTYLHNVNANPYRRPKFAQAYEHFSELIDYKWDRCIMCSRCTRVCDEVIGVTAIEVTSRSLEASISPAFGQDLSETTCTHCGMCIAVCPVGALTDRHFGHHPWELDSTETICGFCDSGCTINIEANRGVVRRTTNLWERGVNHGYTCEKAKWGHEQVQSTDRLFYPTLRDKDGPAAGQAYEVTWDDAIDLVAETLAHYQGEQFAALAAPDATNEEVYLLQQFTRAVMASPNIDRYLTPSQASVERAVRASLGQDVSNTNNMQELFTDVKAGLVVGPDIGKTAPTVSYWFYLSQLNREARYVVISRDEYPLCHRAALWLKPNPGTMATLLNAIARDIVMLGLAAESRDGSTASKLWQESLASVSSISELTGVSESDIRRAAIIYATGGLGVDAAKPEDGYPASLIYQTAAHLPAAGGADADGDPAEIAAACNNLAIISGNLGRPGGGVASLRGPANAQGAVDMGAHPDYFPGGGDVEDREARLHMEAAWLPRWAARATTNNGFVPVRSLPAARGVAYNRLVDAIDRGQIKAMFIQNTIGGRRTGVYPELLAVLPKLDFLVVTDYYANTPLAEQAQAILPMAMSMEKDGTFTSFDRTVQRLRTAVPPMGEARNGIEILGRLAQRLGYDLDHGHPARVMTEISRLVPGYRGIGYARLERNGMTVPSLGVDDGAPILTAAGNGPYRLSPALVPVGASAVPEPAATIHPEQGTTHV
ncbi:MAG: molybdopterin-dependent oxidoreductase [Chloroflexota bacterium]|nr:molybdopterin-dependent oxidoreductase [Chloroflexota bacterium]